MGVITHVIMYRAPGTRRSTTVRTTSTQRRTSPRAPTPAGRPAAPPRAAGHNGTLFELTSIGTSAQALKRCKR